MDNNVRIIILYYTCGIFFLQMHHILAVESYSYWSQGDTKPKTHCKVLKLKNISFSMHFSQLMPPCRILLMAFTMAAQRHLASQDFASLAFDRSHAYSWYLHCVHLSSMPKCSLPERWMLWYVILLAVLLTLQQTHQRAGRLACVSGQMTVAWPLNLGFLCQVVYYYLHM